MAVRPILLYPNPLLRAPAQAAHPSDPALADLLRDMEETLDASPGVALAAPQIGHSLQVVIVDVTRDRRPERRAGHGRVLLLNPRILEASQPYRVREGCLSVPDFTGNVARYRRVVVEGTSPEGRHRVLESSGYEAVAFQHEIDHLASRLFLDRITAPHADLFRRR